MKDYKVTLFHPFRDNKKLLVLDIDYTLFGRCVCVCVYTATGSVIWGSAACVNDLE